MHVGSQTRRELSKTSEVGTRELEILTIPKIILEVFEMSPAERLRTRRMAGYRGPYRDNTRKKQNNIHM